MASPGKPRRLEWGGHPHEQGCPHYQTGQHDAHGKAVCDGLQAVHDHLGVGGLHLHLKVGVYNRVQEPVESGGKSGGEVLHLKQAAVEMPLRHIFAHALGHQRSHIAADGRVGLELRIENARGLPRAFHAPTRECGPSRLPAFRQHGIHGDRA
jgi:hypothetical protein